MRRSNVSRFVRISLWSIASLTVFFTVVIALAHTKMGRPVLGWMSRLGGGGVASKGGCPLGLDAVATPEQRELSRETFAASHRGAERAAARPALGFTLDETSRADVAAWAAKNHLTCARPRSGQDLECADVPDALVPEAFRGAAIRTLWFGFGANDTLVSLTAVRRAASAEAIGATFGAVTADLARQAGEPASVEGDHTAARLSSGPLQQASAEYRFRDYYAVARATNMGDGFVLTEEYRSLPD